ncbi:NINE protein [Radiobacillus kanasensis]|uniref:NINE protein n=1 Tax=Radiobacillus kanasensis TaxID=2844358 RepID=UPI001E60CC4E|nr:NINE protein [Radiobacillus kanasensis]UFU00005.1 NINE protein [Radiobacillus kanasensis]
MKKSPLLALLCSIIPGVGHFYMGRKLRGFIYLIAFFGSLSFVFMYMTVNYYDAEALILVPLFIWFVNIIDIIFTLMYRPGNTAQEKDFENIKQDNQRFQTILLSFIPGVGHFNLGLNQRGLTFLVGFFGIGTMVLFVSIVTHQGGFIVFLLALPIIWIYSLFDTIQLLNKKENGEALEDKTVLDDFNSLREQGKKSRMLSTVLAIFPGAGHMYLGLQKRGLQLMIAFLLSIYILDVLQLSIFLFLIPIIWFFSFFDCLQQANRVEAGVVEDVPVVDYFINHQKWIGIGLLLLGAFYLFDSILVPTLLYKISAAMQVDLSYFYHNYFQGLIVCFLLIAGGFKLIMGSRKEQKKEAKE